MKSSTTATPPRPPPTSPRHHLQNPHPMDPTRNPRAQKA
ncbi:hypothetical protein Patl1_06033 [Pistacia atlantica]|uniref:Uncharacterized protein n=1 Tax=Pistacia atlantica TaxID=434234 RepID=A0ACC1BTM8_9ROSI|nr:hypothetical protein Patl1_06033 [Pistacia atlantica]